MSLLTGQLGGILSAVEYISKATQWLSGTSGAAITAATTATTLLQTYSGYVLSKLNSFPRIPVNGDTLTRTITGAGGERVQTLLTRVSSLRWTFHRRRGDWLDAWPQPAQPVLPPIPNPDGSIRATGPAPDEGVTAVALDITLTGLDGQPTATLRRVASVPLMDPPPPQVSP